MYLNSVGDTMSSRMDKYNSDTEVVGLRTKKNERLYQEINYGELDDINLSSNARVIGDNDNNIDINKIKELLEKKYYEEPKKVNSIKMENEIDDPIDEEITKEYDINSILEKARLTKEVDYEKERLKKIHDTQYNILKSLDVEKNQGKKEENLMELINAINEKEMTRELNPLDILEDLKGSENTVVMDAVNDEVKNDTIKDTIKEEVKKEMDKTFYTNSMSFTQSDFDDFNDLKENVETNKVLVRILLVIVSIALLVGVVVLLNQVFNFNWF
jgi:hypothetical protein